MTTPNNTQRPDHIIKKIWNDYKRWAYTSRILKQRQEQARTLTLTFGVLGAGFATLSTQVINPWNTWFGLLSSAVIAVAGYLGRELLNPESETNWARCRMLSEALKRQAWLALMQVPPYNNSDAGEKLVRHAEALALTVKLSQILPSKEEDTGFPDTNSMNDYIKLRLKEQLDWYWRKAGEMQRNQQIWQRITLGLGVLAILLSGLFGHFYPNLKAWVPVTTSASAAMMTFVQALRFQALIPVYQQTAEQLELVLAKWKDSVYPSRESMIQEAEEIMARENDSWHTEWLAKNSSKKPRTPESKETEPTS